MMVVQQKLLLTSYKFAKYDTIKRGEILQKHLGFN